MSFSTIEPCIEEVCDLKTNKSSAKDVTCNDLSTKAMIRVRASDCLIC